MSSAGIALGVSRLALPCPALSCQAPADMSNARSKVPSSPPSRPSRACSSHLPLRPPAERSAPPRPHRWSFRWRRRGLRHLPLRVCATPLPPLSLAPPRESSHPPAPPLTDLKTQTQFAHRTTAKPPGLWAITQQTYARHGIAGSTRASAHSSRATRSRPASASSRTTASSSSSSTTT